jgi:hypothetical protein
MQDGSVTVERRKRGPDVWCFRWREAADGVGVKSLIHAMTVVTRNVDHFQPTGVAVVNPWQS